MSQLEAVAPVTLKYIKETLKSDRLQCHRSSEYKWRLYYALGSSLFNRLILQRQFIIEKDIRKDAQNRWNNCEIQITNDSIACLLYTRSARWHRFISFQNEDIKCTSEANASSVKSRLLQKSFKAKECLQNYCFSQDEKVRTWIWSFYWF